MELFKLFKALKKVLPQEFSVFVFPTKRRKSKIVVLLDQGNDTDIESWSLDKIYMVYANIEKERLILQDNDNVRFFFCCKNMFILYTPVQSVFSGLAEKPVGDWYGSFENSHFVGTCKDIDELMKYLMTVSRI